LPPRPPTGAPLPYTTLFRSRLLQTLFEDAVQMKASDIHIEPDDKVLRLRLRIDGVLNEQVIKETRIAPALVMRLKILAGLDISEDRKSTRLNSSHVKISYAV